MADYYDLVNTTIINHLKYAPQVFPVLKVELMDYLENTIAEITQDISKENAGSIENNYQQGIRRTCSITLINPNHQYNPSFNRGIWLHTKFKLYVGFKVGMDNYWYSQGIYILTNPSVLNERSNKTITLNGVDKFGVLGSETSFHELNGTYKIPAGTTVKKAIKDLLKMPIGNSGGKVGIYQCTFTDYQQEYVLDAFNLKNKFNFIPSTIKSITAIDTSTTPVTSFTVDYYYDAGTSNLSIPMKNNKQLWIAGLDHGGMINLTITVYEGYPLDPKVPIIDNRTIEYYDAIEFFGDDSIMYTANNRYVLRYSENPEIMIPNIRYNETQPFYKVYVNREEIPYWDETGTQPATPYYVYREYSQQDPTVYVNAIWFNFGGAVLGANDNISIIAKMRGSIGDMKLPYDIVKSPNEFYADLLIEIATVCACDIYYDANGYLNFVKGNEKQEMDDLPTVWEFSDKSNYYFDATLDMDFTNMFNVIKVVGTNESAKDVCEKTVKNTQLNSPMCVQILGEKVKYVESSFCYNQPRTEDFANYLLRKYSRLQETLGFGTILLPFIDVNQVVQITDEYFELESARFIVQSTSLPLTTDSTMQITSSNTANIPYFEAQGG